MVKKGILLTILAVLLVFGAGTSVTAATFTLNSVTINALSADPGLIIGTDSSPYFSSPITFNLLEGETTGSFSIFNIWTTEGNASPDDLVPKLISVDFSFSNPVSSGGPITGNTVATADDIGFSLVNDEGHVVWDPPVDFSFGIGGIFRVSLSDESFNKSAVIPPLPYSVDFAKGPPGAAVMATIEYVKAPTAVPLPPAIVLLGTSLLGVAAIRRKFKN